jgi:hypothetical protein
MKITRITADEIRLECDKIGYVRLSKFSPDFDHGLYRNRPWHVVTFGRNFATVEECLLFLQDVEAHWEADDTPERPVCHAEMTHSFLATEADLDACPF